MDPEERFELPTRGFGGRCSANWNYSGLGSEGRIRTDDVNALQALALDHSATSLRLVAGDGIEPPTGAYETPEIPFL
jgi:hypothetical protein